ncbi:hypothetical protein [Elioraea tepidiphila]|jgi:hypothetical protein|uniref:hypothetical protein n=1 Tax=Elioraea tepidiphila TaxID=457934 RepID=UPI000378BD80|nr:hypothetical protein [Elioraea tepidiphila]
MTPQGLFIATLAVCMTGSLLHMIGGSLVFFIVFQTAPLWWPEVFGLYPLAIAYAASLLIATATLMLGGVPAALVERATRATAPTPAAMWTWLVSVVLLTLAGLAIGFG